jgi:hypothetical protein
MRGPHTLWLPHPHEATGVGLRVELDGGAIALHPSREELTGPEIALLQGSKTWAEDARVA